MHNFNHRRELINASTDSQKVVGKILREDDQTCYKEIKQEPNSMPIRSSSIMLVKE